MLHLNNGKVVEDRKVVSFLLSFFQLDVTKTCQKRFRKEKVVDPPMDKHAAATIETFLYEGIAAGEVFDDVLIFDVVDLHHMMSEIGEEIVIQG